MPVYNVAEFLPECLDSLLHQTYSNLEIICVDDGSPDNSIDILNQYAAQDTRIKILRQKNQKQGMARNNALAVATGEYIYFIDSDDYLQEDYLEKMYQAAEKSGAEVVYNCNITMFPKEKAVPLIIFEREGFYEIKNKIIKEILIAPWNKLIKKSLIIDKELRFSRCRFEDVTFYYSLISQIDKIYIINQSTYYYRQRSNSDLGVLRRSKNFDTDFVTILEDVYNYLKKHNKLQSIPLPLLSLRWHIYLQSNRRELIKEARNLLQKIEFHPEAHNQEEIDFYHKLVDKPYKFMVQFNPVLKTIVKLICKITPIKSWRKELKTYYK